MARAIRERDGKGRFGVTVLERLCRCQHCLGRHLAGSPRPCMVFGCACELFQLEPSPSTQE